MSESILCLRLEPKKLSLAAYFPDYGRIDLSETWVGSLSASLISQLTFLYSPTVVLAPSSSSQPLKDLLSQLNTLYIPKTDFIYESCKELIISKCYGGEEFLAVTSINFSNTQQISCCGALLKFLISSELRVHSIKYSNAGGLAIDFNTLESLQIIKEDLHPSNINTIGRSKEGLSILSLLDTTCTPQGRRKIKENLLRPLNTLEDINKSLDRIEYFLGNLAMVYDIISDLKSFGDLEVCLKKFREGRETTSDWVKLLNSLKCFLSVSKKFSYLHAPPLLVQILCSISTEEILTLCRLLESCLVFSGDRPKIQSGVNSDLDYLQKIYEELDEFLFKLAQVEGSNIKDAGFHKLTVLFMQGLGYLVELSFKNQGFPDTFDKEGYSFQFSTDDCLYFKTPRTLALDDKFGDLQGKIREAETAILLKLESAVLDLSEPISLVSSTIGELDSLFAFTLFCDTYKLTRPRLFETPRLQIVNGRHLLMEICVDNFISNDCALDDMHKVAVITGPNCSGKSVYLKMVGIIAYLAHIGCFIPAEIAEIGCCDQIFSRIHATESRYSSSFAEEISQVSVALQNSTINSLILLDEFGKGTCTIDGMSLVAGLLTEFEESLSPTVILTTHYQELLTYGYVKESALVKFYTMEMAESEEPVFLYKLVRGLPSGSYGIWCAKWAGVADDVIFRAREIRKYLRGEGGCGGEWEGVVAEVLKILKEFEIGKDPWEPARIIEEVFVSGRTGVSERDGEVR